MDRICRAAVPKLVTSFRMDERRRRNESTSHSEIEKLVRAGIRIVRPPEYVCGPAGREFAWQNHPGCDELLASWFE